MALLQGQPERVQFAQTMQLIEQHYDYTPAEFSNGLGADRVLNAAGSNEGSCKIFAFGLLHDLPAESLLHCFGDYYRLDVVQNPAGKDHHNIRNFIRDGWQGIRFQTMALRAKQQG
ncbi:MAG: HopJ type III effector protein [Gammaproteobacteria bacterium]|nr:HopJ type III effector protein [Gammaproteobacteria bacterium]